MIEIEELTKGYKGHIIFDKLNLKIPEGKMTAIYGTSGAGKSTLLNIIGLIEDYDDGKYYFNGQFAPPFNSSLALKMRRNKISYLFQNFALLEDETIEKNLEIALIYSRISKKEKRKKMKNLLLQVGINHRLNTKVYSLSGGEKQRVAIARALLKESQLILADEPTGNLDSKTALEMIEIFKKLAKSRNKCVIVVTHSKEVADEADYVLEIKDKKLIKK